MENKLNNKTVLDTSEYLSLEDLAIKISQTVNHDDISTFIAKLDSLYESWEVTEQLINHFDSLKESYNDTFSENERDLRPENLLNKYAK